MMINSGFISRTTTILFVVFVFVSRSVQDNIFSGNVEDIMASLRQTVGNLGDFVGDKKGCKYECQNGKI